MAQLFDRRCELIAGQSPPSNFVQTVPDAIRVDALRIDFKIEKDDKPKPNRSVISVFNLNPTHRGQLNQKGIRVILKAGYRDTVAQIFSGDARFVNHMKNGPDWVTTFECGDGERSYTYARVAESFGPGTTPKQIVQAVVQQLQLDPGNALKVADTLTRNYVDGYAVHGLASAELTRILEPEGFSWSIQDGRIEVLRQLETLVDEVPMISAKTGMIGSPEYGTGEKVKGPAFLRVKTLLQPRIRPGQKFQVQSLAQKGFFKCRKVVHTGSTHGGEWSSEIEAVTV